MLDNMSKQLFPEKEIAQSTAISLLTENKSEFKKEQNIKAQITAIHGLLEILSWINQQQCSKRITYSTFTQ